MCVEAVAMEKCNMLLSLCPFWTITHSGPSVHKHEKGGHVHFLGTFSPSVLFLFYLFFTEVTGRLELKFKMQWLHCLVR